MPDEIDREAVKRELLKLVPEPGELREIEARVPFTAGERERILAGRLFKEPDDKWLLCPDGDGLLIFRHVPDGTWFFWRLSFEPLEEAWLLCRLATAKSNTSGTAFAKDANQIGFAWLLIDMLLLDRVVGGEEFYFAAAERLSREPAQGGAKGLLELKSSLLDRGRLS